MRSRTPVSKEDTERERPAVGRCEGKKGGKYMVHVARGSEPRLLSFFDLRLVFGRSMVNLYSVAKNQSQSDNTNKAVSATILLTYMDQRPAQHL